MDEDRRKAILEELDDVQSLPELDAIVAMRHDDYARSEFQPIFAQVRVKLSAPPTPQQALASRIAELMAMLEKAQVEAAAQAAPPPAPLPPKVKRDKKYQLLKTDVSWSTKPQVHAIMDILSAYITVGDIIAESDIVRIMVANEHVLQTKQGGERIFTYYKGNHDEGLEAHGNIVEVK